MMNSSTGRDETRTTLSLKEPRNLDTSSTSHYKEDEGIFRMLNDHEAEIFDCMMDPPDSYSFPRNERPMLAIEKQKVPTTIENTMAQSLSSASNFSFRKHNHNLKSYGIDGKIPVSMGAFPVSIIPLFLIHIRIIHVNKGCVSFNKIETPYLFTVETIVSNIQASQLLISSLIRR